MAMRYLILSDIHGNLPALEAALEEAQARCDQVLCLGDVVGYGPQPNECVQRVRQVAAVCLSGNHDWAAIGKMNTEEFNPLAEEAALWTSQQLTPENRAYLESLPSLLEYQGFTLVHGSLREPVWEYILNAHIAQASFERLTTSLGFFGHTHIPMIFRDDGQATLPSAWLPPAGQPLEVREVRFLINPGSVGQPRDGDPRASYLIFDDQTSTIEFRRVEYPIEDTQRLIRQAGLPEPLALRLALGR